MGVCKHINKDGLCLLHSELFYKELCPTGLCADYKPLTNADRIRAMTDAELAEGLHYAAGCGPYWAVDCGARSCEGCWLDWLKQEVDE